MRGGAVRLLDSVRAVVQFDRIRWDADERRLAQCASVDDVRALAKRALPGGVFDYIDGGAEAEVSLRRNVEAFEVLRLQPNVLVDVSQLDTSIELFGARRPLPVVLAPTGFTRIVHPQGELAVTRAAGRRGLVSSLSTMGTHTVEEVASVASAPVWFQAYVWKDRGLIRSLIDRAGVAGYEAVVVTVDTAVLGSRERDVRRGFTLPPKIRPSTVLDGIRHPRWTSRLVTNEPISFANVAGAGSIDGNSAVTLSEFVGAQFDQSLDWDDLEELSEHIAARGMRCVVKGIQRVDDARRAVAAGADAVIVSNHGARQIDGTAAPIELVPRVVDELQGAVPVICDGGVRRGSDIVKACALGATAVMVGRPYLYGLGAAGERGVEWVIDHFEAGMRRTMALCGRTAVADLAPDLLGDGPP